ncbi:neuroligin-4, Y-linked [Chrysoperla carnea]|uniref:neuroligin-4, Y-linked n=1 Tax=Chrysoperla carnea TaxID=189513 RepID=UPI001D05E185|nr:neuroligin-4, Y-linked [Chrysoperla carnea]
MCAGGYTTGLFQRYMWSGQVVLIYFLIISAIFGVECVGSASVLVHKYSTRVVRTKYGPLRGVIVHSHPPVEAFLGVPYATPPLGSLRYMPPVTPSMWRNARLADRFSAVCPQKPPDIGNRTEALLEYPRGRLIYLEKLLPLLANQSEDCLYLNLYVPRAGSGPEGVNAALPCILYVHGESYEWNSGNPYDGTVLASLGHVIVVTINFRLGVLGFLKTGAKGSAQGNFGLMDLVAGLHWLRENLPAFGGDPERITLMGHGTGAALANFIAVSPVAKELLHRVILLSGSGLSPWALQREPLTVKRRVAMATSCHGDLVEDDLAPCLRTKSLQELLSINIEPPRFLPGFAPFIDGTVLLNPTSGGGGSNSGSGGSGSSGSGGHPLPQQSNGASSTLATSAGFELADFIDRDLLFGLTSTESYLDLNAQDLEFGFNETRRDRILRTYVRNSYYYHLNEIFSTLKNEYTDWERPMQNPLSVRDAALEVLSDGHTAAPLIRVGYLHALRGGKTYFLHFLHQSSERDFPQRTGSVRGEDVPYVLGLPLVGGQPFFPHNYTHADMNVARLLIHYLANFVRKGDENTPNKIYLQMSSIAPFWDTYDTINQLYLALGTKPEMRNHYRGHKMSLWLNLIPQLHRPGDGDDFSMRHHHMEEGAQYYDGSVRPQTMQRPTNVGHVISNPPPVSTRAPQTTSTTSSTTLQSVAQPTPKSDTALQAITTECPPNSTISTTLNQNGINNNNHNNNNNNNNNNLLRKLASSHYQSYTTALTVTIAVGCFLLLLNILIFAGIYHKRDRSRHRFGTKKKEDLAEAGSCSSSSNDTSGPGGLYETKVIHHYHSGGHSGDPSGNKSGSFDYDCQSKSSNFLNLISVENSGSIIGYSEKIQLKKKHSIDNSSIVELQEFKSSPPSGVKRCAGSMNNITESILLPPYNGGNRDGHYSASGTGGGSEMNTSPSIPEPPPPPKGQPPMSMCQQNQQGGGILRPQGGPTTPGTMKKRVQIQEISV